jgi:putative transposase
MRSIQQKAPIFNSDKELSEFLLNNLTDSLKQSIKITTSIMVKTEMENLRKEVNEKLSFNGYYDRNMLTTLGKVEGIHIPRWREAAVSGQNLKSFSLFNQQKEQFETLVAEMHRLGISTRKVELLCRNVFGVKVSKNQVGAVHRELTEQESLQINSQPITSQFVYLLLDGLWVKAKSFGLKNDNKTVLLCALGITAEGKRQIIGFQSADKEDFESWSAFLQGLKQRGLTGDGLQLIIADDNGGLAKSLNWLFPNILAQICIVHKLRNVIGKVKHKNKIAAAEDAKAIYQAETKEQAIERMKFFAKKWYVAEPAAVESLRFKFEGTLTYFQFPKDIWKQIRTTNILEREFREVRRRIKVFDNSFNDRNSLNRYGNSIFNYLNNHYPAALTH